MNLEAHNNPQVAYQFGLRIKATAVLIAAGHPVQSKSAAGNMYFRQDMVFFDVSGHGMGNKEFTHIFTAPESAIKAGHCVVFSARCLNQRALSTGDNSARIVLQITIPDGEARVDYTAPVK